MKGNNNFIGLSINQTKFSTKFLKDNGIDYKHYNSKRWDPDEAFINEKNKTVYIIEKNFQHSSGSVDEKLATFLFKIYEYEKLLNHIGYSVQYIYYQIGLMTHAIMITLTLCKNINALIISKFFH